MPVTSVKSKWVSSDLVFYEDAVGQSVTGDVFTIGTAAVKVGGTSQDVDFQWYATGSKSFILDAGAGTLVMSGLDVTINGDLTIDTEDINIGDGDDLEFGDSQDVLMRFSLADVSNPAFVLALDDTSQQMHITDKAAVATDWARSAGTHPELAIHSNTTPITDYLAIGNHDGTTAHIDVVGGTTLSLDIAGTPEVVIAATSTSPATTDSNALGTASLMWSDLFLASEAVINFNNGNVTITHAAGLLTLGGGGLSVGASGAGFDVTLYGDTVGCNFLWDQNLDTNGGLQLGADTKSVNFYAYGLTTGNYLKWDGAADDFSIVGTAARTLHGANAAGNDVIFYGAVASYATTFDADGDTNGSWAFGSDTKGMMVSLYGDITGCGVFWDPSTDTNGTLTIGGSGGSKGNDLIAYGTTNANYLHWDQGTNGLLLVGTSTVLNVAGTVASTSPTTGAAILAGGLGVGGKTFHGETVVLTDAKAVIQGMNDFPLITVTSLTSAGTVALTAAQVIGGFISDAVSEANAATLPTPAAIVAAIPNCKVGTSFLLIYKNAAGGAFTITVTANGSSTIVGTATIAQNNTKIFRAVVTNITGAAEAVTFYSVGTLVH